MRNSVWRQVTETCAGFSGISVPAVSEGVFAIDAGVVLSPFERFAPGRVVIRGDCIEAVGVIADVPAPQGAARIDALNFTLVPGFIDPHVHGCGGFDIMDATPESMAVICRMLAQHGTTSFLPTTVSAPVVEIETVLDRLAALIRSPSAGVRPLGIHLEGPFLNVQRRGTHQESHVRLPDSGLLSSWLQRARGTIKLLTMAPELAGAVVAGDLARREGVVVGMGHSDATHTEALAAVNAGTRYAVHTFNAMRPFSHRDPGIVGAVLADDRVFAEIIADGVHVAPEVVRIFAKAKGSSRVILATDATSATGMPDGRYALGTSHVDVRAGVCRDAEGRLAGSTLTQDRALRNLIQWTGMRLDDALLGLTANPAAALSLEGRGRVEPGACADLVLLNGELEVVRTYAGGTIVFDKGK
jgi:N-acetylglucosamine-6-phosphate deacetylase